MKLRFLNTRDCAVEGCARMARPGLTFPFCHSHWSFVDEAHREELEFHYQSGQEYGEVEPKPEYWQAVKTAALNAKQYQAEWSKRKGTKLYAIRITPPAWDGRLPFWATSEETGEPLTYKRREHAGFALQGLWIPYGGAAKVLPYSEAA